MKFIKKVFMFLLVMVMLLLQLETTTLSVSEDMDGLHDIILTYLIEQDSRSEGRTLRIGYDCYDSYGNRFKFYNPYMGDYLTLNGLKNDDFGGQICVNDPDSLHYLGERCWDHIVITINPEQEFLDNKCLDTLFSLLKESGDITVTIWKRKLIYLKEKIELEAISDQEKTRKKEELENLENNYDWGGTAFMYGQLSKPIKNAIKQIYNCKSDFSISSCCTVNDCYRLKSEGLFFGENINECYGLVTIEPRYIVTLKPIYE